MISKETSVALFDLDGTLFDHHYSLRNGLRSGIDAVGHGLVDHEMADLLIKYNAALNQAYDEFLQKQCSTKERDAKKMELFFRSLGMNTVSASDITRFTSAYEDAYMHDRRATPGTIETLVRLRESGYPIGVVTNGIQSEQEEKIQRIGASTLIDVLLSSEKAGKAKPDPTMIYQALAELGKQPKDAFMVGDSVISDIPASLRAGVVPIFYNPVSSENTIVVDGVEISVIRQMKQVLDQLAISEQKFSVRVTQEEDVSIVEGLGIDIVTADRHCLSLHHNDVRFLFSAAGYIFSDVNTHDAAPLALSNIRYMMEIIAKSANLIDHRKIEIDFPGNRFLMVTPHSGRSESVKPHSICLSFEKLGMRTGMEATEANTFALELSDLLQQSFDALMRDHPRSALRTLRRAMFTIGAAYNLNTDAFHIHGEGIERS
ncbi:MAG: HAD-IA family hydrolase [bacterium]|nr:HAD-IA family hydrolase [bacterium]